MVEHSLGVFLVEKFSSGILRWRCLLVFGKDVSSKVFGREFLFRDFLVEIYPEFVLLMFFSGSFSSNNFDRDFSSNNFK